MDILMANLDQYSHTDAILPMILPKGHFLPYVWKCKLLKYNRTSPPLRSTHASKDFKSQLLTPSQHLIQSITSLTRYSLLQLAKEIDIPYRTLHQLAVGVSRRPHMKTFSKLVQYYCYLLVKVDHEKINSQKGDANE